MRVGANCLRYLTDDELDEWVRRMNEIVSRVRPVVKVEAEPDPYFVETLRKLA